MAEQSSKPIETYANSVTFESSFWDLKCRFGQIDQSSETITTEPRANVTIPWTQAKLISYYLQVNLIIHEAQVGKIKLRTDVLPPEFEMSAEQLEKDATLRTTVERLRKLREEFIASILADG